MGIPGQTKLGLHFAQHRVPLSGSNQRTQHVLNGQVLRPILRTNERNVGFVLVAKGHPLAKVLAQKSCLELLFKARLEDGIPSKFHHVRHGQIKGCPCDRIFFQKGVVRHVKEEGIVRREGDIKPAAEKLDKGGVANFPKEKIVGKGSTRQANLIQIVQILEADLLIQIDPVGDRFTQQVGTGEIQRVSGFPGVGTKGDCVEAPGRSHRIENL
mmetsp:Transcript_8725/g.21469  ORF Transcript_8725/g.21469 Transcript_8725/m.21469 type:complete len:213 (-) Transcript_8725:52-690(-)